MTTEMPAAPKYRRGEIVRYKDHHGRNQRGEVVWIEANWGWNIPGSPPSITYTVHHPTYRNNRMYIGEENLYSGVSWS